MTTERPFSSCEIHRYEKLHRWCCGLKWCESVFNGGEESYRGCFKRPNGQISAPGPHNTHSPMRPQRPASESGRATPLETGARGGKINNFTRVPPLHCTALHSNAAQGAVQYSAVLAAKRKEYINLLSGATGATAMERLESHARVWPQSH